MKQLQWNSTNYKTFSHENESENAVCGGNFVQGKDELMFFAFSGLSHYPNQCWIIANTTCQKTSMKFQSIWMNFHFEQKYVEMPRLNETIPFINGQECNASMFSFC